MYGQRTTMAQDRQLLAGALLALLSGAASAITRVRYKLFASAQSGNQILLSISLANADWPWVGVYAAVIGLYALGAALGFLYVHVETKGLRWAFVLTLSSVFIVLDVLLVEALPDADAALRSFVVSFSALPLGALFAVSKNVLGMPANAMTGNLARDVERAMRRLRSWSRASADGPDAALTHEDKLAFLLPVLFTAGGVAGAEIERNLDYALSVLSPGFALGLFVASVRAPDRERAPQRLVAATTGARRSVRFVLNL